MPNDFSEQERDSEYPEYSEAEGNGTDRFARPRDSSDQIPRPVNDSPAPQNSAPHTVPGAGEPPPAGPESAPPAAGNPFEAHTVAATITEWFARKPSPPPSRLRRVVTQIQWVLMVIGFFVIVVAVSVVWRILAAPVDPPPVSAPGTSTTQPSAPSTHVTPAPANPTTFEDAIVQFDEFTVRGNGDRTFPLPAGITNGVIDITNNSSSFVSILAINQNGEHFESVAWGYSSSDQYTATANFGTYNRDGDYAAQIKVTARGDWELTFRPLTTLEELPDSYSQDGDLPAVFYYTGPGDRIEIVFEADPERTPNITVNQDSLIDFPERIATIDRTGTVTTTLIPGPNLVVIDPSGASSWSITKK